MTPNQRIDASREVRLWAGTGIKLLGIAVTAYIYIPPFQRWVNDKIEKAKIKTVKYQEVD